MAEPGSPDLEEFETGTEEEYDEGYLLADEDEDEDDPDFLPEEGDSTQPSDDVSDTNAPYADAGAAQEQPAKRKGVRVNPLRLLGALRPRRLVSLLQGRGKALQRVVWRLEDASVAAAKLGLRLAVKGARPALIWLIVARSLRTIDRSQDLGLRMMRQPQHKQIDYYYSHLLGDDWQQQMEQDFVDAVAEVDAGYITDEMVRERRGLQAAIMRRLEVEEWDKERMRHFYYGLYGLGPWYWDMEERLHNPFFIGARGWNGPPESWINENQVFPHDLPGGARDFRLAAAEALGDLRGRPLSQSATKRLMATEELRGADQVLASRLFSNAVDTAAVRQQVVEQQQQQQPAAT